MLIKAFGPLALHVSVLNAKAAWFWIGFEKTQQILFRWQGCRWLVLSTSIAFLVFEEASYIQGSEDGSVSVCVHCFVSVYQKMLVSVCKNGLWALSPQTSITFDVKVSGFDSGGLPFEPCLLFTHSSTF